METCRYSPISLLSAALLVLLPTFDASAEEQPLLDGWLRGDGKLIYSSGISYPDTYLRLPQEETKKLELPMAAWIPIDSFLDSYPDKRWRGFKDPHDWTPFLNALPDTDGLRKRWFLGGTAAWNLRALAEKNRITDKQIIPDLIEGLDHPNDEVSRDSYIALSTVTELYTRFPHGTPSQSQAVQLKEWYRAWWQKNLSKDLIVNDALRQRLRRRLIAVCDRIRLATDQPKSELRGFRSPESQDVLGTSSGDGILMSIAYFPGQESSGINEGRAGFVPWIWIAVKTRSHLLEFDAPGIKPSLPVTAKRIYQEADPKSDWEVEVFTSKTSVLEDKKLLAKLSNHN